MIASFSFWVLKPVGRGNWCPFTIIYLSKTYDGFLFYYNFTKEIQNNPWLIQMMLERYWWFSVRWELVWGKHFPMTLDFVYESSSVIKLKVLWEKWMMLEKDTNVQDRLDCLPQLFLDLWWSELAFLPLNEWSNINVWFNRNINKKRILICIWILRINLGNVWNRKRR